MLRERHPHLPQLACFDTAFHHSMPRLAQLLPIPRRYEAQGLRRYGFHGLSYAYLMEELARIARAEAAQGRVILAHLGGGASLAALHAGRCIDTSMAFTPTAGLPMATRSGDLDPGIAAHLARNEGLSAQRFYDMVKPRIRAARHLRDEWRHARPSRHRSHRRARCRSGGAFLLLVQCD